MKKISDYNNKTLDECFDMRKTEGVNLKERNVELPNKDGSQEPMISIMLEKGKFLSYFGTKFAKVDNNSVIHVFKDYMK